MRLPTELVDHTFSFLRGDIPTLKACSKTHPILSQLAERYLYTDIVITMNNVVDSELYECLSKNPRILDYIRTLKFQANVSNLLDDMSMPILSMIPRMANLVSLTLRKTFGYFDATFLSTLFENYLQQSSVEQVSLSSFYDFPLSVLNNLKNIKKLTLSDCKATISETLHKPLRVETLIIHGYLGMELLSQITGHVPNLKSLHLPDVIGLNQWDAVAELLATCSNSLAELSLSVNSHAQLSTHVGKNVLSLEILNTSNYLFRGEWIHAVLGLPLTFSAFKCLTHLSIFASVEFSGSGRSTVFSAFPAIMDLVKTAPAIQNVVIHLHWVNSDPTSLGHLNWSLLESDLPGVIRPRIQLVISCDTNGHSVSPENILEALAEHDSALMDLVKREVVILNAERH